MKELNRIAVVDTETTGVDRERDRVVELAVVLVDVEHAEIEAASSCLAHSQDNAAEQVNQIPASLLRKVNLGVRDVFADARPLLELADAWIADRAAFDRSFFPEEIRDMRPWICSKHGIDWPRGKPGEHLTYLALAHGVAVTASHRALDDCLVLARTMTRAHHLLRGVDPSLGLGGLLSQGLERGIGDPNRCRHPMRRVEAQDPGGRFVKWTMPDSFKEQCTSYVRSYREDVVYCPRHGGPLEWVS